MIALPKPLPGYDQDNESQTRSLIEQFANSNQRGAQTEKWVGSIKYIFGGVWTPVYGSAAKAGNATAVAIMDAACVTLGIPWFLDLGYSLSGNTTYAASVVGAGGVITLGNHNLTFSRTFSCIFGKAFSVSGSGRVTFSAPVQDVALSWYGPAGDGSTDDVNPLNYAGAHGRRVYLGDGNYGVSGRFTLALSGSFVGTRGRTKFTNLNDNCPGLLLKGNNFIDGCSWGGFGSKAGTFVDCGIECDSQSSDIGITNCTFDHMAGPEIQGYDCSRVRVSHIKITDSRGGTAGAYSLGVGTFGSLGSIHFVEQTTGFNNVLIEHVDATAATTAGSVVAKDMTVFVFDGTLTLTPTLTNVKIHDITSRGYERSGVGAGANNAVPTDTIAGEISVTGCHVYNCGSIGIKIKAPTRVTVSGNFVQDWERIGRETEGISGAIHVNNGGGFAITDNDCLMKAANTNSTNAIHTLGLVLAGGTTYTDSFSASMCHLGGNKATGTYAHAFKIDQPQFQVSLVGNHARACLGWYEISGNVGSATITNSTGSVSIAAGSFHGFTLAAAAANNAIDINSVFSVSIDGVEIDGAGGATLCAAAVSNLTLTGGHYYNSGLFNSTGLGIQLVSVTNLTMQGVTSTRYNGGNDQKYGLTIQTAISGNVILEGNVFDGWQGGLGATSGLDLIPQATSRIANNLAIWQGTTSWTPGAIGAGASVTHTVTGLTGVQAGDCIIWSAPGTGNGCVLEAFAGTNQITFQENNPSAGSLTPTAGTFTYSVSR